MVDKKKRHVSQNNRISAKNFLVLLSASAAVIMGSILVGQQQDFRKRAAVPFPDGIASVSLSPTSANYTVGTNIPLKIYFDTAQVAVSGIAVRLIYPYSGVTPEIFPQSITINTILQQSGDWICPTKGTSQQGGNVVIDIACANTSANGFVSNGNTLLADISLGTNRVPFVNPVIIRFDPSFSIITQKANGQDILLIPTVTSSLMIIPVGISPTPTLSLSPTPTISKEACRVRLYPQEYTIRMGEKLPLSAFVSGGNITSVQFLTQNSLQVSLLPASDPSRPFRTEITGVGPTEINGIKVVAQAITKNQKNCSGTAQIRVIVP